LHKARVSKINTIREDLDPVGKDQFNTLLKMHYSIILNNDLKFFNSINKFLFIDGTFKPSLIGIIVFFIALIFPVSMITGVYDEIFISLIVKFTGIFIFLHAAYNFFLYREAKVPFKTLMEITNKSEKNHNFKNLTIEINAEIDKHTSSIVRHGQLRREDWYLSEVIDLLTSVQNLEGLFLIIRKCHNSENESLVSAAEQALFSYTDITEESPYNLIKEDWPPSLKAFYLKILM
jgi:hypothetical protein